MDSIVQIIKTRIFLGFLKIDNSLKDDKNASFHDTLLFFSNSKINLIITLYSKYISNNVTIIINESAIKPDTDPSITP